ncbi:hypothetical protein CK203_092603 [Vitis vinifera]|uniref:Reverse transcriptase domain-containing protein n=1 Tax=Vitis vinifera TaxID=29760 RepID=A0A438BUZ7_VITVI|nr:hypothetical protein CK203_092603 [Vitis vinifera]
MWLKVDGFKDLFGDGGRRRGGGEGLVSDGYKIEEVESDRSLTERETKLKTEAKEVFKKWVLLEETHWRQSSRELWLREDQNQWEVAGEEREVREGVVNAFQQLLSEDQSWKTDIEGLQLQRLSHAEAEGLEQPFTEVEIHSALMGMNGDKAPGPDGFTVAFWQFCWEGVEDLGDFRPISLLGGVYKLLAKVLANRIKGVLDKVVSPDQNAFVKGRQILDASLIANEYQLEIPHEGHAKDGLWGPVDEMDLVVHFNGKFLYSGQWGASWAVDGGFISGCNIQGRGGMEINVSHLLFADDTIILCEARQDHITYLSWILVWFEAASGLRINLAKSEVIPVGEVEDIEMLAVELGCKVGTLPSVYLGLPLGAKHKAMAMWDGVEARMRRRLALWKRQYLSKGGRITLIKSTLANMPIYQLSLFRMPKLVVKRLEKLQRTKEARGTFGVGVWRDILKESSWCWDNIEFKVGKGTKVSFWTDHWCGNEVLSQAFPQLFALAVQGTPRDLRISLEEDAVIWKGEGQGRFRIRDAYKLLSGSNVITFPKKSIWVDKFKRGVGGGFVASPSFSRCLNDWEIEIMECFLARLQDMVVVRGGEDKVIWLETE